MKKLVAVVMGSKSDYDVVSASINALKGFGVECEVRILSAHRTPDQAHDFAVGLIERGVEVVIAAAGKAAHLAGVVAGLTTLPVIAIPMPTSFMGGLDSLLSTVQMPSGVPVASVGVGASENAGILAAQILGIKYPEIAKKLALHKANMRDAVLALDSEINK